MGYDGTYLLVILHQKFFDCLINHKLNSRITSKNKRWAGTTPKGYQALFTANSLQPICKAIRTNVFFNFWLLLFPVFCGNGSVNIIITMTITITTSVIFLEPQNPPTIKKTSIDFHICSKDSNCAAFSLRD